MSVAHVTTREHKYVPSEDSYWGPHRLSRDCVELAPVLLAVAFWRAIPISDHWKHWGEQVLHLTQSAQNVRVWKS